MLLLVTGSQISDKIDPKACKDVDDKLAAFKLVAASKGFDVENVPGDGDCCLHAVVDQMHRHNLKTEDVHMLRKSPLTTLSSLVLILTPLFQAAVNLTMLKST